MNVVCRVPAQGVVELSSLLEGLESAPGARPFSEEVIELASQFAEQLMRDPLARVHPELMALGFFMRRTELMRMKQDFAATAHNDVIRVPQGLVFHVPPGNVDTIFLYSWLLSLLAGNSNIVRLSSRPSAIVDHLCQVLSALLEQPPHAAVRSHVAMVQYDHNDEITAAISARAALRILWGGDASIAAIRRAPLSPFGRDLTFADRWSLMALGAEQISALDEASVNDLADKIFRDVFWFDQHACASPRICLWIGEPAAVEHARSRIWPAVAAVATRREYRPDAAARMNRELFIHREVLDGRVTARWNFGPALAIARIDRLHAHREHPGAGLLFEAVAPTTAVLDRWIQRKDQTLTHAGLARDELALLIERLGGRGLDRVVPVGYALQMARFWDGYDFLGQLVRHVHLVG